MATKTPGEENRQKVMAARRADWQETGRRILRALAKLQPPITQIDLARKSGVNKSTLNLAISGKRGLRPPQLKAVAGVLGVTVDDLTPSNEPSGRSKSEPVSDRDQAFSAFGSDRPTELVPEVEDYLGRKGDAVAREEERDLHIWASVQRENGIAITDEVIDAYLRFMRGLRARHPAHFAARRGSGGEPSKQ